MRQGRHVARKVDRLNTAVGFVVLTITLAIVGYTMSQPDPEPAPENVTTTILEAQIPAVEVKTGLPDNCDPSYPDFCISLTENLVCADVGSGFTALPPDPKGFDPDKDGIAC